MEIAPYAEKTFTDTVYLHLRPTTAWNGKVDGMTVAKMAKTVDAKVEPRDYVVKVEVAIPREFFLDVMPSARIEVEPGKVVPILLAQQEEQEFADA